PAWLPSWMRHRTAVRVGIVVGIFICAWAFDAAFAVRHGFFDLRVYYGALNHWVDGNGEIYDYLLPGTKYGFTYPPFAALTMLPMAYLGWHVAIAISLLLTVVASVAVLYWLVAVVRAGHHGRARRRIRAAARDVPVRPGERGAAGPRRGRPAVPGALQPQRRRRRHRYRHRDQADPGHLHRVPRHHPALPRGHGCQRHHDGGHRPRGRGRPRRVARVLDRRAVEHQPGRRRVVRVQPVAQRRRPPVGPAGPGEPGLGGAGADHARRVGVAVAPGGARRRRGHRLRADRHRRRADQPDHVGASPRVGAA